MRPQMRQPLSPDMTRTNLDCSSYVSPIYPVSIDNCAVGGGINGVLIDVLIGVLIDVLIDDLCCSMMEYLKADLAI